MLKSVSFDGLDSLRDLGLMLRDYPVAAPPDVQMNMIDIPGRDGPLDLSDALDGDVHFSARAYSVTFLCLSPPAQWPEIYSKIQNALHGRRVKIRHSDMPGFYYVGRLECQPPDYNLRYWPVEITGTVDPYKYEERDSVGWENWLWDDFNLDNDIVRNYNHLEVKGFKSVKIENRRMRVVPTFVSAAEGLHVVFGDMDYKLPEGASSFPAIRLKEGENTIVFYGVGEVSIVMRGGEL